MSQPEYSKNQLENLLELINNQEKQILDASSYLVNLLESMDGIDKNLIEEIKLKVSQCLSTRKFSEQEIDKITNTTLDRSDTEKLEKVQKIPSDIKIFCENFKNNIKWVKDIDTLINYLKNLIKENTLKINQDPTWKEIYLSCLDYEIKILNLWNYNEKKYNITTRNSSINPDIKKHETDITGMNNIWNHCSEWRKIPTEKDIQNILKNLATTYSLKAGREWSIHDEDIAFFMLITQSDWEFLLKKDKISGENRVLKMYHDFRWFKDLKKNWTGQIILIRKKQ